MASGRYWRVVGFMVDGSGALELTRARLWVNGSVSSAAVAASLAPTSGSVADLALASNANIVSWDAATRSQSSFSLSWDLGVAADLVGLELGAGSSQATYPNSLIIQSSVDNLNWNTEQSYNDLKYPGNSAISSFVSSSSGDPDYAKVVLLLHGDGSNGSTTIVDKSQIPKTITTFGNAVISTAQSKFGGSALYFDGSGDYLSVPTSTDFDLGDAYTIEFWIYPNIISSNFGVIHRGFYSTGGGNWTDLAFSIRWLNTFMRFYFYATNNSNEQYIDVSGAVSANTWTHIAMVRNGYSGQVFVNGVSSGTISGLNTPAASSQTLRIGEWDYSASVEYFNGYLDDIRITKGVARYTGAFSVPSAAFPDVATFVAQNNIYSGNVSLLLHGTGADGDKYSADSSFGNKSLTFQGTAQVSTAKSKFGTSSLKLDSGGTAMISVPASLEFGYEGDFTLEAWVNPISWVSSGIIFAVNTTNGIQFGRNADGNLGVAKNGIAWVLTGSALPALDTWSHVAAVRSSGTLTIYLNGASIGSVADTFAYPSGEFDISNPTYSFNGYIDEVRITKGVARYTANFTPATQAFPDPVQQVDQYLSNTVLILNGNGANGSTTILDTCPSPKVITLAGDTKISTAQAKFGPSSIYFDGTGDSLSVAAGPNAGTDVSTADFTVEFRYYTTSASTDQAIFTIGEPEASSGFQLAFGIHHFGSLLAGAVRFFAYNTAGTQYSLDSSPLSANTWYHMALTREGNTLRAFLNGTMFSSMAITGALNISNTCTARVGKYTSSTPRNMVGYLDDFRLTIGKARYTASFTPSASPVPEYAQPNADYNYDSTVLLLHGNGTNGSTTFTDNSGTPKTLTANGSAQLSTAQSRFGASSIYINGSGNYVSVPNSSDFNFGIGEFTIEAWIYVTQAAPAEFFQIVSYGYRNTSVNPGWNLRLGSNAQLVFESVHNGAASASLAVTSVIPLNTWAHVAVSRTKSAVYFAVNGIVYAGSASLSGDDIGNGSSNNVLYIGASGSTSPPTNWISYGYIDDLRITKGVARYTNNFVPPSYQFADTTSPQPGDEDYAKVSALLKMDGANTSTVFIDSGPLALSVSAVGNAQISTAQSKFGGTSAYFDGSGDYLTLPNSSGLQLNTSDFTAECWIYPTAGGAFQRILSSTTTGFISSTVVMRINSSNVLYAYAGGASGITGGTVPLNVWSHIAMVRASGVLSLYLNGVFQGSEYSSNSSTEYLQYIGGYYSTLGTEYFNGYIDDVRITKGLARYTQNFNLPTNSFPLAPIGTSSTTMLTDSAATIKPRSGPILLPQQLPGAMDEGVFGKEVASAYQGADMQDGGWYKIQGTVFQKGTPNTAVHRRVVLLEERSGRAIRETWSDATSGAYSFKNLSPDNRYTVLAYDHTGAFRAVIADAQVPEPM